MSQLHDLFGGELTHVHARRTRHVHAHKMHGPMTCTPCPATLTCRKSHIAATYSNGGLFTGSHRPASNRLNNRLDLPSRVQALADSINIGHHACDFHKGTTNTIHALHCLACLIQVVMRWCGGKQKFHSHCPSGCNRQSCANAPAGKMASGSHTFELNRGSR